MKKKLLSILMVLSMLFQVAVFAADSDNAPIVEIDGNRVTFADQQPVILEAEGRTMVPARGVFEEMGAAVKWDADKRLVTINSSNNVTRILITIDDPTMIVYRFTSIFAADKDEIQLDAAPRIINDRTMIPLRAISEALNAEVKWEESTRTISIFTTESHGFYTPRPGQTAAPSVSIAPSASQNPSASPSATTTARPGSSASPSSSPDPNTSSGTTSSGTNSATSGDSNLNNAEVYITSDKTSANVGDIITISMNVKGIKGAFGNDEGIEGVDVSIKYDKAVFEYVDKSIKYNTDANVTSVVRAIYNDNNTTKFKAIGIFAEHEYAMRNDGMLVQMQFKVLSKTSSSMILSDEYFSGRGYETRLNYRKGGKTYSLQGDSLKIDRTPLKIN